MLSPQNIRLDGRRRRWSRKEERERERKWKNKQTKRQPRIKRLKRDNTNICTEPFVSLLTSSSTHRRVRDLFSFSRFVSKSATFSLYTLSYKRKINIIGKGHLEIGIATYFGWLSSWIRTNDNIHSTAFVAHQFTHSLVRSVCLRLVWPMSALCEISFPIAQPNRIPLQFRPIYIYLVMIRTWFCESMFTSFWLSPHLSMLARA